mgnify:CR=1 FL=1
MAEESMQTSDELIAEVGKNIQEKAALIWNVADTLRGPFKPHEYGLVILPMTVVKRFDDCLVPTHDEVLRVYEKVKRLAVKDGFLREASGYPFYNISKFTLKTLLADPENIEDNFRDYLAGFSDNVQDILSRMNFDAIVDRLSDPEAPLLYQVIVDFNQAKADMSPEKIKPVDMGYIFENLVQRFSESYNEDAGAHFTSRDIVYLMTDLLIAADPNVLEGKHISKTVYDQTMGTSQMLSCTEERLRQLDAKARVTCFGQEFNPFTFGIAKASALIRNEDDSNMQFGDTLSNDKFKGYEFDYCISNPPFGDDWKVQASAVKKEAKDPDGRFGAGIPAQGDGQMLFMLNGLAKLKEGGVMVIVQDASPLYKGKPERGESEIRRYILENDWLEAIIQLPTDSFYNTGISTYLWVIHKTDERKRKGQVLLIDASQCYEKRRKAIGDKKNDITKACRDLIIRVYGEHKDGKFAVALPNGKEIVCKSALVDSIKFGFNRVPVAFPEYDAEGQVLFDKKGCPMVDKNKSDVEDVPLLEDIDEYFERMVYPYTPDAWPDKKKIKIGYSIPFTKTFYEYQVLEPSEKIASRILNHEHALEQSLETLFGKTE